MITHYSGITLLRLVIISIIQTTADEAPQKFHDICLSCLTISEAAAYEIDQLS